MNSASKSNLTALAQLSRSEKTPLLFMGHGNPMNAIEDNEFVTGWKKMITGFEKQNAVLCISAHWETRGTMVTAMQSPRTIHDFGGFPKALFDVQYPAAGSPELAHDIKKTVKGTEVTLDHQWGLDHGTWSVVKHLYPNADIPIVQMSLDIHMSPQQHYNLAKELSMLRHRGVLVIGSGNMVHNLRRIAWDKAQEPSYGFDWAIDANNQMKKLISSENHTQLIDFRSQGSSFDLAIPTPEHYLPLLYILGVKNKQESVSFFNDKTVSGSISMTSLLVQ